MTRKITVNMYMTLDGYAGFPKYPGSDSVPEEPDLFWTEMWIKRYGSVDTVVMGRRSFEGHFHVHTETARKPKDPKYLFEYSRWLDRVQKVALSHYMVDSEWQNTRIMKGELKDIISQLKGEPGKDIIVEGGPSVAQECIQRGLADDYQILVQPVILGRGIQYWGTMLEQQTLKLLSVKNLEYGELILHYEAVR